MTDVAIDQRPARGSNTAFDLLVNRWNKLNGFQRRTRAAECKTKGHDWEPLSWGPSVCKRCLTYRTND